MNDIKIFNSEEFGDIRTVQLNNEIYFVGKDVAKALGYSNTRDALATHVTDEDKNTVVISDGKRGNPNQTVINESGLYALIFGSKLESAKRFKHWVTSEVLPAIRKTGSYQMSKPEGKELLAMAVLEAQKTIEQQSSEIKRMKPKEIFADAVSASKTSILVGELAKILSQNGVEIGQNRLYTWLRDNGYLIKRKGVDWNMPTQKAMNLELFEVKETVINNPDGSVKISKTTKVTGKGQQYFINKFLKVA